MKNFKLSMIFLLLASSSVANAAGGKGMTWGLGGSHDATLGIDMVGCSGVPALPTVGGGCDPYMGDTSCKVALPLLCVKVDYSPRPNYAVYATGGSTMPSAYYQGWLGGHMAVTAPVFGTNLRTATTGDDLCKNEFGEGWRMAEHHDGKWINGMTKNVYYGDVTNWKSTSPWPGAAVQSGAWAFYAYGNLPRSPTTRFWVKANDQPSGCWNP